MSLAYYEYVRKHTENNTHKVFGKSHTYAVKPKSGLGDFVASPDEKDSYDEEGAHQKTNDGMHERVTREYFNELRTLDDEQQLGNQVDTRSKKKGKTALFEAVKAECPDCTRHLLKLKADPRLADYEGNSPLSLVRKQLGLTLEDPLPDCQYNKAYQNFVLDFLRRIETGITESARPEAPTAKESKDTHPLHTAIRNGWDKELIFEYIYGKRGRIPQKIEEKDSEEDTAIGVLMARKASGQPLMHKDYFKELLVELLLNYTNKDSYFGVDEAKGDWHTITQRGAIQKPFRIAEWIVNKAQGLKPAEAVRYLQSILGKDNALRWFLNGVSHAKGTYSIENAKTRSLSIVEGSSLSLLQAALVKQQAAAVEAAAKASILSKLQAEDQESAIPAAHSSKLKARTEAKSDAPPAVAAQAQRAAISKEKDIFWHAINSNATTLKLEIKKQSHPVHQTNSDGHTVLFYILRRKERKDLKLPPGVSPLSKEEFRDLFVRIMCAYPHNPDEKSESRDKDLAEIKAAFTRPDKVVVDCIIPASQKIKDPFAALYYLRSMLPPNRHLMATFITSNKLASHIQNEITKRETELPSYCHPDFRLSNFPANPFIAAARENDAEEIQRLLTDEETCRRFLAKADNYGMTALMYAGMYGHSVCVGPLANALKDRLENGKQTLFAAIAGGQVDLIEHCLNAKLDAKGESKDFLLIDISSPQTFFIEFLTTNPHEDKFRSHIDSTTFTPLASALMQLYEKLNPKPMGHRVAAVFTLMLHPRATQAIFDVVRVKDHLKSQIVKYLLNEHIERLINDPKIGIQGAITFLQTLKNRKDTLMSQYLAESTSMLSSIVRIGESTAHKMMQAKIAELQKRLPKLKPEAKDGDEDEKRLQASRKAVTQGGGRYASADGDHTSSKALVPAPPPEQFASLQAKDSLYSHEL